MAEPKLIARQWQPQDLLEDLQMLIDEKPDTYFSDRSILETAKAYLEEYFSKDTVEVVRCKDCTHWKEKYYDSCNCEYVGECHAISGIFGESFFCGYFQSMDGDSNGGE